VQPLENSAVLELTQADALESAIRSGPGFTRNRAEFKGTDIFSSRFATAASFSRSSVLNTRGSDEKPQPQFTWNADARTAHLRGRKSFLFVGRKLNGAGLPTIGVSGTNGLMIIPLESRQDWACFQATVIEGDDFDGARRILITATGDTENTGLTWMNAEKTSVGRKWGGAPVLVEGPAAKIVFPREGKRRAWALDETGQRRAEIPLTGKTLEIGPQHRTLWYEVIRE
jgi:hypothetical protein